MNITIDITEEMIANIRKMLKQAKEAAGNDHPSEYYLAITHTLRELKIEKFIIPMLIFFLVTSCVTVPKGHNHSRKEHRLETTPKSR